MQLTSERKQMAFNILYTAVVTYGLYWLGNLASDFLRPVIVIPGNIIGMGLLYLGLETKIVCFGRIKAVGEFLLKHLSLFFVPFGVSIIKYYPLLKGNLLYFILIIFISTIAALSLSGWVLQKRAGGADNG